MKCFEVKMLEISKLYRFRSVDIDPNLNIENPKFSQISKFFIIPNNSDKQDGCHCFNLPLIHSPGTTGS